MKMKRSNIWKINIFLTLLILSICSFQLMGTEKDDIRERMLEIKLSDEYIFGEGFNDEKEIAYGNALSDLLLYANELKIENGQTEITLSDLQTNVETLACFEGNRYEVIVYLPLKNLDSIQSKSPNKNNPVSSSNVLNNTKIGHSQKPINNINFDYSKYQGEIEDFLLTQENFSEIKDFLSAMKHSGKISETGAGEKNAKIPENANLIVIDNLGGILSILSPIVNNGRFNYKTRQPDNEQNYSDCKFIVWYKK